ncbi:MAG: tetratricopeptide repeat protein [Chloroflexota bacterium]
MKSYKAQYEGGDRQGARNYLDQGLQLLKRNSNDTLQGHFYKEYCNWYFYGGQLDTALMMQRKTVFHYERGFGFSPPTAEAYHNLGYLSKLVLGQVDSALYYYGRALEIYERSDKPLDVVDEYRNIGIAQIGQKDYGAARNAYKRALAVIRSIPESEIEALSRDRLIHYVRTSSWLYLNISDLELVMDDMRQARVYLSYSQDILEEYVPRLPELEKEKQENRARVYQYLGLWEQGIEVYKEILRDTPSSDRNVTSRMLALIADMYYDNRQFDNAILYGERLREYEEQHAIASSPPLRRNQFRKAVPCCKGRLQKCFITCV